MDTVLKIRDYPFPYRAALSISNDIEFMSFNLLEKMMAFLNTDRFIKGLGRGLNIPVSSSFFFYSMHKYNFSYFDSLDGKKSEYANRMVDYFKTGYLDTIHSYGDFDKYGGFKRHYAERAFEEVKKNNLKFYVYTNHGDRFNIQNLGGDAAHSKGDLPSSPAYHSDLTVSMGVRFLWSDGWASEGPNCGLKDRVKGILLRRNWLYHPFIIMKECALRDKNKIVKFSRFRSTGKNAPNLSSLGIQINRRFLDYLVSKRESVIIYQHLGVAKKIGNQYFQASSLLPAELLKLMEPLRMLSEYYHQKIIWVERLFVFLKFIYWRKRIKIVKKSPNRIEIIPSQKIIGDVQEELQYITFYIDWEIPNNPIEVECQNKKLSFILNDKDEEGLQSVTISPTIRRVDIWN